jgi:uncharacterized protein YjfI (DUF2170 family)
MLFCSRRFIVASPKKVAACSKMAAEEQLGLFLIKSNTILFLSSFIITWCYSAQKYQIFSSKIVFLSQMTHKNEPNRDLVPT